MTCEQYWEWSASEDDALRERAQRHFAECAECRSVRSELERSLELLARHPALDDRHRRLWLEAAAAPAGATPARHLVSQRRHVSTRSAGSGTVAALTAAALLVLVAVLQFGSRNHTSGPTVAVQEGTSTSTPVVTIPLTFGLCFGQIEFDLQTVETRLQEVSEALSLIELQRDVQQTLEQARRWDD